MWDKNFLRRCGLLIAVLRSVALRLCAFALKMLPSHGCHYAKLFCALERAHLGRRSSATGTVAHRGRPERGHPGRSAFR